MPNVRRLLVREGIGFRNGFVTNALCCPSRSSLLTGRYSHSTGVYTNNGFRRFHDSSTVATWLDAAGYRTGLIGKYLNGYGKLDGNTYIPPGWDRWAALAGPDRHQFYDYTLNIDGAIRTYGHDPSDYLTTVLGRMAVQFINGSQEPFFLYFAPTAPHMPATPAPGDADSFRGLEPARPPNFNESDVSDKPGWVRALPRLTAEARRRVDEQRLKQYRSLLEVDRFVGRIVEALKDSGRLHSTMIVFMSDNGFSWGEHRWALDSVNKQAPYEEDIRVPFVVRFDRLIGSARSSSKLVTNIDLAPTWAALARTDAPEAEGKSLLPILRHRTTSWRNSFLVEHLQTEGDKVPTYCALRSLHYSYVAYRSGFEELYSLRRDPYELNNRARDRALASVRSRMRSRLRRLCDPPPPGYQVRH
jgi:N-acetylglucosamine-6-sulfatase